jgi:hypothetical protein
MDRTTDSSKAICPPFFEGGHNNLFKIVTIIKQFDLHVISVAIWQNIIYENKYF